MPIYSTGKSKMSFLKSGIYRKFKYVYKLDHDHLINQTNGLWNTKFNVHELSFNGIMTT